MRGVYFGCEGGDEFGEVRYDVGEGGVVIVMIEF